MSIAVVTFCYIPAVSLPAALFAANAFQCIVAPEEALEALPDAVRCRREKGKFTMKPVIVELFVNSASVEACAALRS
jgi:hypothetical protein